MGCDNLKSFISKQSDSGQHEYSRVWQLDIIWR